MVSKFYYKIIISIFLMKRKHTKRKYTTRNTKRKYKRKRKKTIRKKRLKYKRITRLGKKWMKQMEIFMKSVQE